MLKNIVVWEMFDDDLTFGPFVGEANACDVAGPSGMLVEVERIDLYLGEKGQSVGRTNTNGTATQARPSTASKYNDPNGALKGCTLMRLYAEAMSKRIAMISCPGKAATAFSTNWQMSAAVGFRILQNVSELTRFFISNIIDLPSG